MEELKQVDEEIRLLYWWKGKWGEQALWEIELRLESIKVEKKIELDALCIFGDVKYLIWLSSVY